MGNTNLTVMTLFLKNNLNHIWITQAELRHICTSFMFVTIFFKYENPLRKNFINPSCAKHPYVISDLCNFHFLNNIDT